MEEEAQMVSIITKFTERMVGISIRLLELMTMDTPRSSLSSSRKGLSRHQSMEITVGNKLKVLEK